MLYIDDIGGLLHVTDLMVTRAGAATISEAAALKVPLILIPSPYVTDNHQLINASDLVKKDAALLIEEKDLNIDNIKDKINYIFKEDVYNKIKENISKIAVTNSATKIYDEIIKLIRS